MTSSDNPAAADLAALEEAIRPSGSMIVAFSGGVDSAVLLAAAHRALGDGAVALTADSPSMARAELEIARAFTESRGIRHVVVRTGELEREEYARNDRDRCYWCKQTLFSVCAQYARAHGNGEIAYGYTADDAGQYRPGHGAAREFGVRAPLFDARLGKDRIRAIARLLGLEVWDKPAAPCLSSRIPYGSEVTAEKLRVIETVETLLHELGFRVCRARYDGELMRIEVEPSALRRASEPAILRRVEAVAFAAGVNRVVVDPEGFRSGRLNQLRTLDDFSRTA